MQWDLGVTGLGLLFAMSLGFGAIVWIMTRRGSASWLGSLAVTAYFLSGLFVSEIWFGWATEEELQPNIDGLSFDEVLLIAPLPAVLVVLVAGYGSRRRMAHPI